MNTALYAVRCGSRMAAQRSSHMIQRNAMSSSKNTSGMSEAWNAILSRNFSYITFIVLGAITVETIYGGVTNGLWNGMNRGKLYKDIDWSKFEAADDEEGR